MIIECEECNTLHYESEECFICLREKKEAKLKANDELLKSLDEVTNNV